MYDRWADFDRKVNFEMVAIEQLDDEDRASLRLMIECHAQYTGSAVANRLLASWSVEVSRFRKVMPIDYKRVLTVIKQAKLEGLNEEQTVDRIMEAARG